MEARRSIPKGGDFAGTRKRDVEKSRVVIDFSCIFPRSRPHLFGVDVVVSTTSASNYTVTWTPKPGDPM
jgi:hypothetical protein